jgi:hypothetical protein
MLGLKKLPIVSYCFKILQSAAGSIVDVSNSFILRVLLNQIAALFLSTF